MKNKRANEQTTACRRKRKRALRVAPDGRHVPTPLFSFLRLFFCSFVLLFFCSFVRLPAQQPQTSDTYREAYDAGYQDGLESGKQDKGRTRFDFANKKAYQLADRGLDSNRHVRDVYLVGYKRGFEDGYEQGYGLATKGPSPNLQAQTPGLNAPPAPAPPPSPRGKTNQIPAGAEIKVRLLDTLSSRRNEREDTFRTELVEDIRMEGGAVIPRGTQIAGSIGYVKRAGRIMGRSEMGLRFGEIQLADGSKVPIHATLLSIERRAGEQDAESEGIIRGEGTKSEDVKTVGTSSGIGALIGVLGGGRRGAVAGAAAGAAVGIASVITTRGRDVELSANSILRIKLDKEANIPLP